MNWPFPFHLFSYLSKNPADLFSSISSPQNPSSSYASPPQHNRSSKLVLSPSVPPSAPIPFISLTAPAKEELHKQTMTYHFPQGVKAVYQRTNFSTSAGCRMWQYSLQLFAVLRYSDEDCDGRLSPTVRAQKQQGTNYRGKHSPRHYYTHSPFFVLIP